MSTPQIEHQGLKAQQEYCEKLKNNNFDFGVTVGQAFIKGIRELGYKNTGTALDELIDNSIQSEADKIQVSMGFKKKSDSKPNSIAVIDNGHGMVPDMIRMSAIWGGTHREDSRKGFGRFGYGLPSACVSQGKRFTVYSLVEGMDWYSVTMDLDDIEEGKYNGNGLSIIVPEVVKNSPPDFIQDDIEQYFGGNKYKHGTIVLIEKLDRHDWKTAVTLKEKLVQHTGVIYRNFLRNIDLRIQETKVEPIDPLFTTPGYRYFDIDEDKAKPLDPIMISVKDPATGKVKGELTVRFASFPATFGSRDKAKKATGENKNPRFLIMKENNGIIFTRMGRQIDVVIKCPWLTFMNNDRYWSVEVDFPAELDEDFKVTTSKQRVEVNDRIWDILKDNGTYKAIEQLRKIYNLSKLSLRSSVDHNSDYKKPSEEAMENSQQIIRQPVGKDLEKSRQEGQENLKKEIKKRTKELNRPEEEVRQQLVSELKDGKYRVESEEMPGAPFFRCLQLGGTKVLYLNRSHRFYSEVYFGPGSNRTSKSSLEVLLFVIGDCMLGAPPATQTIYNMEIAEWSKRLEVILNELKKSVVFLEDDEESTDPKKNKEG